MTITDEASTGELLALTTRQQRTKWVVVVDRDLPIGLIANAAACLSATIGQQRPDLLGPATAAETRNRG